MNFQPQSSSYGRIQYQAYSTGPPDADVPDWVAIPGQIGIMAAIQVDPGGDTYLMAFNTTSREWTSVTYFGTSVTEVANPSFSGLYPASDGYIYATEGNSGAIWRFSYRSPYGFSLVSRGPIAVGADGARCGGSTLAIQPALPQFACGGSGYLIQVRNKAQPADLANISTVLHPIPRLPDQRYGDAVFDSRLQSKVQRYWVQSGQSPKTIDGPSLLLTYA